MKLKFWKIEAEVTTNEISLAQYKDIKKWLIDNKIKHKDRYGDGCGASDWGWKTWVEMKEQAGKSHEHIFEFYREKDAVFFKTRWK